MIKFRITLDGSGELLMHNARLANPLDPATKLLKKATGKRTKTDDDHEEIARLEFLGSLYYDADAGPYLPSDNIWRCLYDAAKKTKMGVRVKEGLVMTEPVNPLSYRGPRDPDDLWKDTNYRHMASVKVGMSRTMRCRPVFRGWHADTEGMLDPNVLDLTDLTAIASTAGLIVGIGDWRPRYGRFTATVKQVA